MPAPNITASATTYRYGAIPKINLSASGAAGLIAWSASPAGSFDPVETANGQQTVFSPSNETQSVVISARDKSDNATSTIAVTITATCPDRGQFGGAPVELDDRTNVSTAEDGGSSYLVKGPPFRLFSYTFPNRTQAQYDEITAFWLFHRKTRKFYLEDPVHDGVFRLVRFDSKLAADIQGADMIQYAATFREAVPS